MKPFFLSLLFFLSLTAKAVLVLPPDISDQEKRREFARQIISDMPTLHSASYSLDVVTGYVAQMHRLLFDRGLAKDEEFKAWAAERPDLKTYLFSSYHTEQRALVGVLPAFMDQVREYFAENFAGHSEQGYEKIADELVKRLSELSKKITPVQSQALMAGLGSLFPQDQRREILTQKNISLRSEALKSALSGIKESDLRNKFQSERFGIPREDLTLQKAIELLDSTVRHEIEFIKAITLLETVNISAAYGEIDFSTDAIQWFLSENQEARQFLTEFDFQGPVAETAERLRSIAKNSFALPGEVVKVQVNDHSILVVESPPHLAIFRGCSGGDCSTSNSWAYPFSPKERNFYFYDVNNPFVEIGYVSGNIVQVAGVDTFYIRDLTGPGMKPEHVDILVQGFAQMLPEIGVSQMTLTSPGFAKAENHFPVIRTRIAQVVEKMSRVAQRFPDARLRKQFIDGEVRASSYDAPSRHKFGRLYDPEALPSDILPVRAERMPDDYLKTARAVAPKGRAFIARLEMAISSSNYTAIIGGPISPEEWARVFRSFNNMDRLSLTQYYENIAAILEKFDVRMSAKLMRDFPNLFYTGHLNAKDAFTSADAALVDLSYRIVIERFVRLRDYGTLNSNGLSRPILYAHPHMVKAVNQFITRMSPADIERVSYLTEMGYPWESLPLTDQQVQFVINSVRYWSAQTSLSVLNLVRDRTSTVQLPNQFYAALAGAIGLKIEFGYRSQSEQEAKRYNVEEAAFFLARAGPITGRDSSHVLYSLRHYAIHDKRPLVAYASAIAVMRSGRKDSNKKDAAALEKKLRAAARSTRLPKDLRDLAREMVANIDGNACIQVLASRKK